MPLETLDQYLQAIALSKAEENTLTEENAFKLRDIIQEALWDLMAHYSLDPKFRYLLETDRFVNEERLNANENNR